MNDILLSIIIPVYNVEQYLPQCIESILSSGFDKSCELILVDDGSTDRSGEVCDQYQRVNVIVIHKPNGGLSSARNAGIEIAHGKYIAFIDSDDFVADEAIKNVLTELEQNIPVDLYFMQVDKLFSDGTMMSLGDDITSKDINDKTKMDVLNFLAGREKFAGSACSKVIRRSFLSTNSISFPKDKRYHEDLIFVLKCIRNADSYHAMDFPYYRYRQQREGSITNSRSSKGFQDLFLFIDDAAQLLTKNHLPIDSAAEKCMSFVAYEYCVQILGLIKLSRDERRDGVLMLKKCRWVLNYAQSRKTRTVRFMLYVMGYRLTSMTLIHVKKIVNTGVNIIMNLCNFLKRGGKP